MITNDAPTRVFEVVSSDLFTYRGRHYLVYVDILSGWPVVYDMTTLGTTSKGVIKAIRKSFADLGVPNMLKTDGGLQYTSREFKEFLKKCGVKHIVVIQSSQPTIQWSCRKLCKINEASYSKNNRARTIH